MNEKGVKLGTETLDKELYWNGVYVFEGNDNEVGNVGEGRMAAEVVCWGVDVSVGVE